MMLKTRAWRSQFVVLASLIMIMMRAEEAIAQPKSEGDGFLMNKQMETKIDNSSLTDCKL